MGRGCSPHPRWGHGPGAQVAEEDGEGVLTTPKVGAWPGGTAGGEDGEGVLPRPKFLHTGPQPLGHGPVWVCGLLGTGLHSRR